MKIGDEGNKRKLSKRLDPELSLDYYRSEGYHPEAVREYLLTVLNSNFEDWRKANPTVPIDDFKFTTGKMSSSGALFDLNKLKDVSKDVLVRIPAEELYGFLKDWSDNYAPEFGQVFSDRDTLIRILDIGRTGKKPRKDLVYARQIMEFIGYFFDDMFKVEDDLPEEVNESDAKEILTRYGETFDINDDQEKWFDKIRNIASELGYAGRPKDYKNEPEKYKGHVGHVSTVIRLAIVGRSDSPDLWEIQQIMGTDKIQNRIATYLQHAL